MAFKSFSQYQEDKNGDFFVLPNDGDFADVVFLYKSVNDVLVADVHYITTATYKGYVHCCENGCPACSYERDGKRGIRVDHKIFIPLFNISKNKIEFWDRSTYFEQHLQSKVFKNFPDPSQCVFRVTRHGVAGSRETTYDILPIGRNANMPYEKILSTFGMTLPDGYSRICKEMSVPEMYAALNTSVSTDLEDYGYTPVPRGSVTGGDLTPSVDVQTPVYSEPPVTAPPAAAMPDYNMNINNSAVANPAGGDDSDDGGLDDVAF